MNQMTPRRLLTSTTAALTLLCVSEARAEFCRTYVQTWSSAGRCDACRLKIVPTPAQGYRVEANNGWNAEVSRRIAGESAKGRGRWNASLRHAYAGKTFKIALDHAGAELRMAMLVQLAGRQRIVLAKFRCLERELPAA